MNHPEVSPDLELPKLDVTRQQFAAKAAEALWMPGVVELFLTRPPPVTGHVKVAGELLRVIDWPWERAR